MQPKKRKANNVLLKAAKPAATPSASATTAPNHTESKSTETTEGKDDWWALAQHDSFIIKLYKLATQSEEVMKDPLFDYLAVEAGLMLSSLRADLESIRRSDDIGWSSFLSGRSLSNYQAEAVQLFLLLRRDFGRVETAFPKMDSQTRHRLADMVRDKFPVREIYEQRHEASFRAFSKSEAPGRQDTSSSLHLLEQVHKLRKLYDTGLTREPFLSPYTALIGPSGIGKSFAVKNLAEAQNRFIVYASLGEKFAVPLPAKPLSKMIRRISSLHTAIRFFKNFVNVGFGLVYAAKTVGIPPGVLFLLQSGKEHFLFQEEFANLVGISLDEERRNITSDEASTALVPLLHKTIKEHGLANTSGGNESSSDTPPLIICLDEARFLLTRPSDDPRDDTPLLFRGFRRAMKASDKTVFGLLLDTSSKIGSFLPPIVNDPSLKIMPDTGNLLPPIYSLQTWDVVARASPQVRNWLQKALPHRRGATGAQDTQVAHGPDGSIEFQQFLYSLGRPLWASIMQAHLELERNAGESLAENTAVQATIDLAREKTFGEHTKEMWLALLSYRLQFHVHDQHLVDALTSRWLRFPIRVSKDRSNILSIQPREPILAAVAAWKMSFRKPLNDMDLVENVDHMINALFQYYNDGAIDVGDTGEMIASFLLLWAADVVAKKERIKGALPQTALASAILMVDFLGALFGSKPTPYWTMNAQGKNDAEDTCVFVTHITRLCTDSEVGHLTPEQLEMGFLTGEGWLLEKCHAGADLLLPVWHQKTKRMTALLIQVKNIKPRSSSAVLPPAVVAEAWMALEGARKTLECVLGNEHVYGLYLDLGDAENHMTMPVEWLMPDNGYPRLSLAIAHGCSADVYSVLAGHDVSTNRLRAMLARGREPYADDARAIADMVLTRDGRTL